MLKAPKKYSKKELKHDPLVDGMLKVQTYYDTNKSKITNSVLTVVVIVAAVLVFNHFHGNTMDKATTILGKAQVELDQFNQAGAESYLTMLEDGYAGTDAADQGVFLLAGIKYKQKQFVQSKELYKKFVDSYSGSAILLSSGYAGLAACYEEDKSFDVAAEYFNKAWSAAGDLPQAAQYLYLSGLDYKQSGNQQKAMTAFQKVVDDYSKSAYKFNAETELVLLASK